MTRRIRFVVTVCSFALLAWASSVLASPSQSSAPCWGCVHQCVNLIQVCEEGCGEGWAADTCDGECPPGGDGEIFVACFRMT